jgi:predicted phosphodiesterase
VSMRAPDEPVELEAGVLGVVTDIHGNPYALEAVLSHGARCGVDRWLVLGDVVAMGPEPGRVMDQLTEIDVVAFVTGNTERYVVSGDRPGATFEEVVADPTLLPRLVELAETFSWTKGYLKGAGSLDALRTFVPNVQFRFPDGTRALAVHASLVADDGDGITPELDEATATTLFPACDADIVFGGHTHRATDLTLGGTRYVNPGSASNHPKPHVWASYSIVRLGDRDHNIEHHQVPYDKQLVVDSMKRSGMPGSDFLIGRYFSTDPSQAAS